MAKGGKTFQDREKAANVRHSVLDCIGKVLNDEEEVNEWSDYKKEIVRRMSTSILPRLNEHTGEDGGPIEIKGNEITVRNYGKSEGQPRG